jgi:ribosomal protein S27AE
MQKTTKMICPKCGAEMNHHAVKIDYGRDNAALTDNDFGGILEEVHTCPKCGATELRVVPQL